MSSVVMDAVIPTTTELCLYRTASFSTSPRIVVCLAFLSWIGKNQEPAL